MDCWPVASPVKSDRTVLARIPYITPIIHLVRIRELSYPPNFFVLLETSTSRVTVSIWQR